MMIRMRMMMIEEKKENSACYVKSFIADPPESLGCLCLMFVSHAYYFDL